MGFQPPFSTVIVPSPPKGVNDKVKNIEGEGGEGSGPAHCCRGKGGPLSRGECITNLVLGETYRLRQVTHKSTAERPKDEDTVAAHLITTAQPSHFSYEVKQATSRAKPYSETHHAHIFALN